MLQGLQHCVAQYRLCAMPDGLLLCPSACMSVRFVAYFVETGDVKAGKLFVPQSVTLFSSHMCVRCLSLADVL